MRVQRDRKSLRLMHGCSLVGGLKKSIKSIKRFDVDNLFRVLLESASTWSQARVTKFVAKLQYRFIDRTPPATINNTQEKKH